MEKKLTVKFQKLLGSSVFPPGVFVEGQKFERLEGDTAARRGSLFSLVTMVGPGDFDAPVFGRAIFDTLEEEYFADSALPPLPTLEKAAFSAHRRLVGMALSAHLGSSVDFNLVLAVLWGQVLYLCRLGSAGIYLLREGKVSEVPMGDETLVTCASGYVESGDTLILGTKEFKNQFPAQSLGENLLKLEEKMQGITQAAALVLKIEIEEYPNQDEEIKFINPSQSRLDSVDYFRVFKRLGKKIKAPTLLPGLSVNLTERGIFLPRPYKKLLPVLAVLLIFSLFIFSVFWTVSRQSKLHLISLSQKTFAQADLDIVAASDLVGLNDSKSAEILDKTLTSLRSLEKLGLKNPKLSQYKSQVEDLLAKVSKEIPVEKPRLVYDFSLVAKNIKPTNLAGSQGSLYVGDTAVGGIYRLKMDSPSETQKIDGGKITSPIKVSAFADSVFVLTKEGVAVVNAKTQEVAVNSVPALVSVSVYDFQSYNSNLYFLDTVHSQIQRSLYGQSGYGKPTNWLKDSVSLEKAVNLAINGSVYVLLAEGHVLKFEAGKLVDFSLSGYVKTLGKETFISAGTGVDDIFLIDRQGRKIVRFNEGGVFQKTYDLSGSEIVSLDSLYLSPENSNLYLLSGTKVYEVKP